MDFNTGRQDIIRLAQAVLRRWYLDGCPVDWTWYNPEIPELGTWQTFWESVSFELELDRNEIIRCQSINKESNDEYLD